MFEEIAVDGADRAFRAIAPANDHGAADLVAQLSTQSPGINNFVATFTIARTVEYAQDPAGFGVLSPALGKSS